MSYYHHIKLTIILILNNAIYRKSVAQVVKNAGEQYRPKDWYTSKSCERQFKILVSNLSKEVRSLPLVDMLQHIAEGLRNG